MAKGSTKSIYSVGASQRMIQRKKNKRYYIHINSIVLLNCNVIMMEKKERRRQKEKKKSEYFYARVWMKILAMIKSTRDL